MRRRRQVATLPGMGPQRLELIRAPARAIDTRDRTADGYYGGCWNGPADGPASRWSVIGSRPRQAMTSARAVNVIVAGAVGAGSQQLQAEGMEDR